MVHRLDGRNDLGDKTSGRGIAVRTRVGVVLGLMLAVVVTAGPASADVWIAPTHLTIHVKDSHVYGKLVGRPECRPGMTIHLFVDGVEVATTVTGPKGDYSFNHQPNPPESINTYFGGAQLADHPDHNECSPSSSRTVRVNVRAAVLGASGTAAGSGAAAIDPNSVLTGADVRRYGLLAGLCFLVGASLVGLTALARRRHSE
jgi:hypothetical protein